MKETLGTNRGTVRFHVHVHQGNIIMVRLAPHAQARNQQTVHMPLVPQPARVHGHAIMDIMLKTMHVPHVLAHRQIRIIM